MLDLHALVDAVGSVVLANMSIAANIPANDGQTAPGVPIAPGAVLKGLGVQSAVATPLEEAQLISQDQIDPINGEHWFGGAASACPHIAFDSYLPFSRGGRNVHIHQVVAGAAAVDAWLLDQYPNPGNAGFKNYGQKIMLPQLFGAALVAQTWGTQPVAPVVQIPAGRYALLCAYVHQIADYGVIRFNHADFGGKRPGFACVDSTKAVVRGIIPPDTIMWSRYGSQFVALGDIPVFNATAAGCGLTIDMLTIGVNTPHVTLNLQQVS
ncbi:hypothetical protein MUO79_01470 [Candidatus Bathyarchaeota archaeon]|nr:hypothetical protein [Candidatus Bathyarchaeota archaeon]